MSTSWATDLLGSTLLTKDGNKPTADALSGAKAVGLYFSAHWCPPCRGFTPKLADAYKKSLKGKGLEIVFVSSDKEQDAFASYYGEQPWLALPYDDRKTKAALSKKFKVNGIPTFVVLDGATGALITADGRESVMEDPTGKDFPWTPPTFWDALGSEFLSGTDGDTVEVDELKGDGKVIGLYFSAHWCPPCRGFTPALIDAYKKDLKGKGLEIIFVSSDKDQESFLSYFGEMPWLAIPHNDPRKSKLSKLCGVEGIPQFTLFDGATGEMLCKNARGKVGSDPTGDAFPWPPAAYVDIAKDDPEGINEETCLIVLLDGCDQPTTDAAVAALAPIAEASKAAGAEMVFFYASSGGGVVPRVRDLCKVGSASATPQMLLLDIPDNGGYYVSPATEVNAETISGFLDAYKAAALDRQQLG